MRNELVNSTMESTIDSTPTSPPRRSRTRAGVAGLAAGALALGIGELVGAFFAPVPGPVVAVANQVVASAPLWLIDLGKSVFGTGDKVALLAGTVVLSLLFAILVGRLATKKLAFGAIGIALFGALGFAAITTDPQGTTGAAVASAGAATAAGIGALALLTSTTATTPSPINGRRSFLTWVLSALGVAAVSGYAGKFLRDRSAAQIARDGVQIAETETAASVGAKVAAASQSSVAQTPGITPLVIDNGSFYRIDTATLTPQVDPASWKLRITGLVERDLEFTYDDLLARAEWVTPVTLSCVSNEVGGGLVGNAVWHGIPLTELLDEAGVLPEATQISSRSVDGWDCGFPTELAYDGRTAMVAVAMNGEPLPIEHGFPARLVVSGLYGYVSATKWLDKIELTTIEEFNGFWISRGWSKNGPVKTQSRIDVPRRGQALSASSPTAIAGVAWAPNTGIERVEVQIDDNDWVEADLGEALSDDSWLQWSLAATLESGDHFIRVRATDKTGFTQTADPVAVAPDGAEGWHTVQVSVA